MVTNRHIAAHLDRIATLLEARERPSYRSRAYRAAAATVRRWPRPLSEIVAEGGRSALMEIPTIGRSLAATIESIAITGRCPPLESLEEEPGLTALLAAVPGIGPKLARDLQSSLGARRLADLERAARDGRLDRVVGIGPVRSRALRSALPGSPRAQPPSRALLLQLDREYRRRARAGELPRVPPRTPGTPWVPVLHRVRQGWAFTVRAAHGRGNRVRIHYRRGGSRGGCSVESTLSDGERRIRGHWGVGAENTRRT